MTNSERRAWLGRPRACSRRVDATPARGRSAAVEASRCTPRACARPTREESPPRARRRADPRRRPHPPAAGAQRERCVASLLRAGEHPDQRRTSSGPSTRNCMTWSSLVTCVAKQLPRVKERRVERPARCLRATWCMDPPCDRPLDAEGDHEPRSRSRDRRSGVPCRARPDDFTGRARAEPRSETERYARAGKGRATTDGGHDAHSSSATVVPYRATVVPYRDSAQLRFNLTYSALTGRVTTLTSTSGSPVRTARC